MTASARHQVAINVGFTLLKSGFVLLSIRLADVMLTAQMMGLVLLFRRQGALWSNLAQLGLSQVLLKFYAGSDDPVYRARLWQRLVRWIGLAMLGVSLACLIFSEPLSQWLFPSAPVAVTAAFGVYVAGLSLGFIANSSWLAEFRFIESNLIDWLHGSLLFVFCLIFASDLGATTFSWLLAVITVLSAAIFLHRFARKFGFRVYEAGSGWKLTGAERQYGITRALTAYADMATMVIGPWLLRDQLADAAQLIAAYTVLRIAQTLVLPVAQVFALRANSAHYRSKREERRILSLGVFVLFFSCAGIALYYLFGSWVVNLWLPNSGSGVIEILNSLMPTMPGICLFYAFRSYVDLRFDFPWNLTAFALGCAVFLGAFYLGDGDLLELVVLSSIYMLSVFYLYSIAVFALLSSNIWRQR